jgi:malate dehydrogenase (oxaloacetate-decarboxylating)
MDAYKAPFAQSAERIADWRFAGPVPNLLEVIENGEVTVLLGLSGQAGAFNQPIVEAVSRNNSRPVVFPLSNPTSIAEALPEDIFAWTDGRAIVATGSPFEDVVHAGKTYPIGQGNNAFVFPGLGFASILSEASRITDGMVLESAYALADYTAAGHVEAGRVYPPIRELPEVSIRVTTRVMARAIEEGVARKEGLEGRDLDTYVRQHFWRPRHLPFVRGIEPS